jgi:hypothetical protein
MSDWRQDTKNFDFGILLNFSEKCKVFCSLLLLCELAASTPTVAQCSAPDIKQTPHFWKKFCLALWAMCRMIEDNFVGANAKDIHLLLIVVHLIVAASRPMY